VRPAISGRVLHLARSADLLRRELEGARLAASDGELLDDVSTDEIAPAWASYFFDERLARDCLTGLRERTVLPGAILAGGFAVVVAGANFGCGSSRETAPLALFSAGIRLVVARSFARIFRQNADNIGLLTTTDFDVVRSPMLSAF
jgi:3-isopropylmalate/(R)-2-methylmalate dehydratase large subunit